MKLAADSPLKFGWVEDGHFAGRSGNTVTVEFPPSLESHTQTLFWPQAVKKIEEQLSTLLGEKISFAPRFTGAEPAALPEPEPIAPPVARTPSHASSSTSSTGSMPSKGAATQPETSKAEEPSPGLTPEEMESFKADPLIKKALEIFKAEILNTKTT
jgi:hypothetical protein